MSETKPRRHAKHWGSADRALVTMLCRDGYSNIEIAGAVGRTPAAVANLRYELGLPKYRKPGRHTRRMEVGVSPPLYAALERAAKREGVSVNGLIRKRLAAEFLAE